MVTGNAVCFRAMSNSSIWLNSERAARQSYAAESRSLGFRAVLSGVAPVAFWS